MKSTILKVDSRNRISLTRATKNLSSLYRVYEEDDRIILEPIRELRDHWILKPENRHLLAQLEEGLKQKATISRGSFAKYATEEDE